MTAAGTARPTYKTAIQNGKPVLRFDGSSDVMTTTISAIPQPFTVFFVAAHRSSPGGNEWFGTATDFTGGLFKTSATNWRILSTTQLQRNDADTNFHLVVAVFNGSSSIFGVDGTTDTTGNAGTTALGTTYKLGDSGIAQYGDVDIGECGISAGAISATDRTNLLAHARSYWATP